MLKRALMLWDGKDYAILTKLYGVDNIRVWLTSWGTSMNSNVLVPPRCPTCMQFVWIRWKGKDKAQCKSCSSTHLLFEFYAHGQSYVSLGTTWEQKLTGETE